MKVAVISHLFPTELYPFHGKFIKDQLSLLNSDDNIIADLYVPTPYSIPFTSRNQRNNSSLLADEFRSNRVKYLSFPKKRFPQIIQSSLSKTVEGHFQDYNYDIIHVHWLYPDGMAIPKLKELGYKCVLTIHGSDWYKNSENEALLNIFEESFHAIDHIFFVGDQLSDDVASVFPFLSEKSSVIYNFVDEAIYTMPSKEDKEAALKSLGWNPNKIHFLTVASSNHEKGVDLLVDAAKKVKGHHSDIEFHVIGSFQDYFPISHSIQYHPPVPPQELITYYHASDAYISPSRKEGFGLAMIEAAVTGLPVIATPTGIAPNFIEERTGILCDEISTESIAEAITELSNKMDSFHSEIIRMNSLHQFGKEVILEKLLKQYYLLIN